jgi:hypothetical protein
LHETDAPSAHRAPWLRDLLRRAALALLAFLLLVPASASASTDSDGDGLRDAFEARWGVSDPGDPDSDGDGVVDPAEDGDGDRLSDLGEQRFGTDPAARDSDGDGRPDGAEDRDGDGRSDALEQDQRPLPTGLWPSLARAPRDLWPRQDDCGGPRWGDSTPLRCWFGDPGAAVTVAVVGDSKATMLMPPLLAAARQRGWRVVTLLKGTCSPVLDTTNVQQDAFDGGRSCERWRRRALDWLGRARPALIVYAHSDDYGLVDATGATLTGRRKDLAWKRGAAATVARLPQASDVLWLGDVPRNDGNPVRCLRDHRRDLSACLTRREPPSARTAETALRRGVTMAGARFAPLYDQVCTYDPCPLVHGATLLWRDDAHLTATFSRFLAPFLGSLLDAALPAAETAMRTTEEAAALPAARA